MSWEEKAKNFLKEIVEIYSPTGREKTVSLRIASFFKELGFENIEVDDMWNVSADVTYGTPTVYLIGHIDTVPGRLPVKYESGRLYGRGAVDAKAPFATFVMAAYILREEGFDGGIKVAGVVDEEVSGRGIRRFAERFPKPDYAVFGEPSGPHHLTLGYKGRVQLTVEIETSSYHASAPWLGPNAFEKALEVYEIAKKTVSSFDRANRPGFDSISLCITIFKSGESINVTPRNAEFTIDIRIPPYVKAAEIARNIESAVIVAGHNVENLKIRVEEVTEAYEIKPNNPLVRAFSRGVYKVLGRPARLLKKTGTGDMNYYGGVLNVPSLTAGPGNPKWSHTLHEFIDMKEYISYVKIVKEALKELKVISRR